MLLTHFDDAQLSTASARLAREARSYGTVVNVRHVPKGSRPPRAPSRRRIGDTDLARGSPARFRQMHESGRSIGRGYVDLIMLEAMRRLPGFHRYWFIEHDVDFSGPWGAFFARFERSRADLVGAAIQPRALCKDWIHWSWFRSPADARPETAMRGLFPVVRLSRRFAEFYAAEAKRWAGHAEALLPSVACHAGFTVEDMGGHGPMARPNRRGRTYSFRTVHDARFGTFRAYPSVASSYFPFCGQRLPLNTLWHPVKTAAAKAQKRR